MATMSAAPTSATTLTPPSSSHGSEDPWTYAVGTYEPTKRSLDGARGPLRVHNANPKSPPDMSSLRALGSNAPDLSPPYDPDDDENTPNGSGHQKQQQQQHPAANGGGLVVGDENSKWIHRDKLARIESEELQAAGIILPKAIPRPRKDRSTDRLAGAGRRAGESPERAVSQIARPKTRSGRDSISSFDPERMAELAGITGDGQGSLRGGINGSVKSRIPIPKFAPAPVSLDSSDNDPEPVLPETRTRSKSTGANSPSTPPFASNTKRNVAAAADSSPRKGSSARKPPPAKTSSTAASRSKTRAAADSRSASAANRPTTRSGELSPPGSLTKRPEGEPPWMISAYKPDPRLPPDEQLLPTVARRLQQEKWEKEGKFGNIYDKEFRPLNDEGYLDPPEQSAPEAAAPPPPPTQPTTDDAPQGDWPLKQDAARSPALNRGSSYSTMPKIQDTPAGTPLGSPKGPSTGGNLQRQVSRASTQQQVVRLPEEPEPSMDTQVSKKKTKDGCGLCCIVM